MGPAVPSRRAHLELLNGRTLRGHVVDVDDLASRGIVEVLADGLPIGVMRADLFDEFLWRERIGDGCYGFTFELPEAVAFSDCVVEVRLANIPLRIGEPIDINVDQETDPVNLTSGAVAWSGGLVLSGNLGIGSATGTKVRAILDGVVVAEARARDWTHVQTGHRFGVAPAFRLCLPESLADGRVRYLDVVASDGTVLVGSPCFHIAFKDGLANFIDGLAEIESEKIRADRFDALFPRSVAFDDIACWLQRFPLQHPSQPSRPGRRVGVVLVGAGTPDRSVALISSDAEPRWTATVLSGDTGLGFRPVDLEDILSRDVDCDVLVFAPAGTLFEPQVLSALVAALDAEPAARSVYCDRAVLYDGMARPLLLPAFDYERCIEQGYCAELFAMRRSAVLAGLAAGARSLYRLFNAQFDDDHDSSTAALHCPEILGSVPEGDVAALSQTLRGATEAHIAARGLSAQVSVPRIGQWPAVRVSRRPAEGRVSVIISRGARPERLLQTLHVLRATAEVHDPEIIVTDTGEGGALRLQLDRAGFPRVLIIPGTIGGNRARTNNEAVLAASGTFVLCLHHSIEAASEGWLGELLGRLGEPDTGAVGPVLVRPSGVVESAGFVLGPDLSAVPACSDRVAGEAGYAGILEIAHECSAISGVALLTRRALYLDSGGMDDIRMPIDFADVDFCLKLRQRGFRLVVTPHASLCIGNDRPASGGPNAADRRAREAKILRHRWGEALLSDPYYNPGLSLERQPFSGLAWPPRPRAPRRPERPSIHDLPAGF